MMHRGMGRDDQEPQPYRLRPQLLTAKRGLDLDRALRISDRIEDDETLRKLAQRK